MAARPAATAPPAASATARGEHQGWPGQCLCPCLWAERCVVGCAPRTLPFYHRPEMPRNLTHPLPHLLPLPPCSYRSEKAGAPGEYRPEFRGGFGRGAAPQ